jgi:AbrB family looped-hinge helix DNA binding protein
MQTTRIRVRKKGQVTLPQELRDEWEIDEGSEIMLTSEKDYAVIRPIRRTKIKQDAGSLGHADRDEIDFAVMDPELISQYYAKKYRN